MTEFTALIPPLIEGIRDGLIIYACWMYIRSCYPKKRKSAISADQLRKELLPGLNALFRTEPCVAVQHSDQMVCHECKLTWDVDDISQPACGSSHD